MESDHSIQASLLRCLLIRPTPLKTLAKIKKSAGWLEFFFESREDFSVLKLSEAKNDWLYYIIDQVFITTDKKILNEEIIKIYNFELKKTKSILFEWLSQGYKDRRF